jgi:hypothetical protein
LDALQHTDIVQQQCAKWHDKIIKNKLFHPGDWALLYESRFKYFKGKLHTRWLGPYEVDTVFDNITVKLITIDGEHTPLLVNGHCLQLYHHPTSKDSFIKHVSSSLRVEMLHEEGQSSTPSTP